jgi:hypothetical protein
MKLYTTLWTNRLSSALETGNYLSSMQKGFLAVDGCGEHAFVAQSLLRNKKKGTSIAFLDLKDAFGSVPHDAIILALKDLGAPEGFIQIVADIYANNTFQIKGPSGARSRPIPVHRGVRQGDPLSPLLFNIVINKVLQIIDRQEGSVQCNGVPVNGLAYADDVLLSSNSPDKLQKLIHTVESTSHVLGLLINPLKCATVVITANKKTPQHIFTLSDNITRLPTLEHHEFYEYLGVKLSNDANARKPIDTINKVTENIKSISASLLTPFQKLVAIKRFILPQLGHVLRTAPGLYRTKLASLSYVLTNAVKKFLKIPQSGTLHYMFASSFDGGLQILPPHEHGDICIISQAYRLLTSPDTNIKRMAHNQLIEEVRKHINAPTASPISPQQIESFLNANERKRGYGKLNGSLFFQLRLSLSRLPHKLGLKFHLSEDLTPYLSKRNGEHTVPLNTRQGIQHSITEALHAYHGQELRNLSHQGAAFHSINLDSASTQFNRDGHFISLPTSLFSHRARLGLLLLNGQPGMRALRRKKNIPSELPLADQDSCRRCLGNETSQLETQAHVLNRCPYHLPRGITLRHNQVLKLIHRQILSSLSETGSNGSHWDIKVDSQSEVSNLRPDLVCTNVHDKRVFIVDISIRYEHDSTSLENAWNSKVAKYTDLGNDWRSRGYHVDIGAIIVGSLGSWTPKNDGILRLMGVKDFQIKRLKRHCVSASLDCSRRIYFTHIMGERYNQSVTKAESPTTYLSSVVPVIRQ